MDISETKTGIARKYIGKHGIHGCGIGRAEGEEFITIVFDPEKPLNQAVKDRISGGAKPYKVRFLAAGPAYLAGR